MKLHLPVIAYHPVENLFNLVFLALKLAKFLVKVVNQPDCRLIQLVSILIFTVAGDHGYVEVL